MHFGEGEDLIEMAALTGMRNAQESDNTVDSCGNWCFLETE